MEPLTETGALRDAVNSMLYALHDDSRKNLVGVLYRLSEWLYEASEIAYQKKKGKEEEEAFFEAGKLAEELWRFVIGHSESFELFKKQRVI